MNKNVIITLKDGSIVAGKFIQEGEEYILLLCCRNPITVYRRDIDCIYDTRDYKNGKFEKKYKKYYEEE